MLLWLVLESVIWNRQTIPSPAAEGGKMSLIVLKLKLNVLK